MIHVYKIMHGMYDKDCTLNLLLSHNTITLGHRFKLLHIHLHLDLRKYFFINRIVSVWNSLPEDVVSAATLNIFKNKIDKHWVNQECKFNWKANISETGSIYYKQ